MRYHYEKPDLYFPVCGKSYRCNHPVYDICTLYLDGSKGLSVIQQRYDPKTKHTWWSDIDPWLVNEIYISEKFQEFFDRWGGECKDGLYPTVTVRQIMWALRMKPMKTERWNTTFDHKNI